MEGGGKEGEVHGEGGGDGAFFWRELEGETTRMVEGDGEDEWHLILRCSR